MNALQLIHLDSGETDYWTPPEIIKTVRDFLGQIDLDPASSAKCNRESVKAKRYFTAPKATLDGSMGHDGLPILKRQGRGGLDEPWDADCVWINHPFAKAESACELGCEKKVCKSRGYHISTPQNSNDDWVQKMVLEHREGRARNILCITYAATSEKWYQPLLARPQCNLYPRTNYLTPDGKPLPGVSKGSSITYFGKDVHRFATCFNKHGIVKVAM